MASLQNIEFIDILKKEHIDSILTKIHKGGLNLQIWQKEEPLRQKTNGILKGLNLVSNTIELEASKFDAFIDFQKDEIYFYSAYRTTIFKSKILKKVQGHKIVINYPELMKIKEARLDQRHRYGIKTNHRLDILFETESKHKIVEADIRVLDSSDNGCAILISKKYATQIKKGTKLIILQASLSHLQKRAGVVRSIFTFRNNLTGEQCYRLGIELLTR